jgi:tRNA (adenine37-N6)-methyltransferase
MAAAFSFEPIGIVHSPFHTAEEIPIERSADPVGFDDVEGELEIEDRFSDGLRDLERWSHLIVLFVFHRRSGFKLSARPPFQAEEKGIFATRSPHRPNPIGLTVVRLIERRANVLRVAGLDMIDGTPILDLKPYTAKDRREVRPAG